MESKWCLVYSHDAVVAKLDELVGRGCQRITHCPDSYNTNGDVNSWFITYIEPEIVAQPQPRTESESYRMPPSRVQLPSYTATKHPSQSYN